MALRVAILECGGSDAALAGAPNRAGFTGNDPAGKLKRRQSRRTPNNSRIQARVRPPRYGTFSAIGREPPAIRFGPSGAGQMPCILATVSMKSAKCKLQNAKWQVKELHREPDRAQSQPALARLRFRLPGRRAPGCVQRTGSRWRPASPANMVFSRWGPPSLSARVGGRQSFRASWPIRSKSSVILTKWQFVFSWEGIPLPFTVCAMRAWGFP